MMPPKSPIAAFRRPDVLQIGVWLFAAAAMVSLALEFGFERPPLPLGLLEAIQFAAVTIYLVSRIRHLFTAPTAWTGIKDCAVDFVALVLAALALVVWVEVLNHPVLKVSAVSVAVIQGVLAMRLVLGAVRLHLLFSERSLHPTRTVALTFAGLIVLGTLALALPRATTSGLHDRADFSIGRHLLNCAFTATSATCVTGLAVYDTEKDFTLFGQSVILLLIQLGGLGIMLFGSAMGLLVRRQLSLRQTLVVQDELSHRTLGDLAVMIRFIVAFTLMAEGIGAVLLWPMWSDLPTWSDRVFHSLFHSISAFCNAGFSLQSDSLIGFRGAWPVYGAIMPLIVVGGLGFPVLHDLWMSAKIGIVNRRRRKSGRAVVVRRDRHPLSLHTKLVLVSTGVLLVGGALAFFAFESITPEAVTAAGSDPATMAQAGVVGRWFDAMFLSVTCRTAGFNTVSMELGSLSSASLLLAAILMFIGGAPASTAGGVKTLAVAVLLLAVGSLLRGRPRTEVFQRTVADVVVQRAGVLVLVMFAIVSLVTLTLCLTDSVSLPEALFEAVSACGTVGLSTGLTPELTAGGRVVIMAAMFMGRLGPLSILIALAGRGSTVRYEYPTEHIGIG
ncbi:MAG: TrkH family potassium uptake protein [Phycisphaerae bacterium]